MDPNVFIEYMEFIRQQRWCIRAASSYCTPLEIFDIIKPRMLKVLDENVSHIPVTLF